MIFMSGLLSARRRRVRQERHLAGVLDRTGDLALLLGTDPGDPAGPDLATVGDELAQQRGVLVIDVGDPLLVERVHLLLGLAKRSGLRHCSLLRLLRKVALRRSCRPRHHHWGRAWPWPTDR